jgi:hypothetical protein
LRKTSCLVGVWLKLPVDSSLIPVLDLLKALVY